MLISSTIKERSVLETLMGVYRRGEKAHFFTGCPA